MLYSTSVATPLGTFRLSADDQGLSEIILPESSRISAEASREGSSDNTILDLAAQQIQEYCAGVRTEFDLPLSVNGTRFQRQVWDIIHHIPFGQTMSYGEIARQLGTVRKARAVGGAANANPLPLVIPCHRVIGSDGTLTGFAGGIDLKKRLLRLEKNILKNN
jgi:methylated-DNA-[protein]-cysteine S-methyltransferase